MDPQLKERLIGAAVLVALGVWLIPWILDGRAPEGATAPPALELPTAEETPALRTQTITLDERREPEVPARAALAERSLDSARPSSATEAAPELPPSQPAARTPAPVSNDATATAARAAPAAQGGWMVQLGSFGEQENADRLAKRIDTFGFSPEVTTMRSGDRVMYRVRVGPHANRDLAEAAASSLSAHGFVAQVVTVD